MMRQFQTVSCGDGEIDSTETCDDGNRGSGDACSAGCDAEFFVALEGLAQGGSVSVTVQGVLITVTTTAGQTAAQVAQALADAINAAPGVTATATAVGGRVIVDAPIEALAWRMPGSTIGCRWRATKDTVWWASVAGATGYDLVRGELTPLLESGGDFLAATKQCMANDLAATQVSDTDVPPPDKAFWYLVRDVANGVPGTYDSGGAGQAAPRDPGILVCD